MRNCQDKESVKLYRIGIFAQLNRTTVKTLRYYDEIGLLLPEQVDEINGYRYYTSSQMPTLHKIMALKEIGFTISEIKEIFEGASQEQLLIRKKNELLFEVAQLHKKLASVESYISGGYLQSDYRIIVKSLPAVSIASMRVHMDGYEDLFDHMPKMGMLMEQVNCECIDPAYCFTIYHDDGYREKDIDAQICEAVVDVKEDYQELKFETLDAVEEAACLLHKGPYYALPKAYTALIKYIEENGYEMIAHQRESYIDGVWNKDSEEDWLTEIQFPVRKLY